MVEKKFSHQVVIASHPKVNYGKIPDCFEGRKVVYKQTHRLVKDSKFVIAGCSTAINFAVIYKKPIILLTIKPSRQNVLDLQTKTLASELGKIPIYCAGKKSVDWGRELTVNEELYSQYLATYIRKPGSPEKPIWEIFADYVENLNLSS